MLYLFFWSSLLSSSINTAIGYNAFVSTIVFQIYYISQGLSHMHKAKYNRKLMNSSSKINTQVLESHVKDVLSSAKSKLTDLNKDIDKLSKENEDLQKNVDLSAQ